MDAWIAIKLCDAKRVSGITVDNNGIIYFTTTGENIYQLRQDNINTEPQILVNIKGARLYGIVWNGNNILYICDFQNHRVLSYSIDTGNLSTLAGDEGHHDEKFCFPEGIAMDRNGDLYITDCHCVKKINLSSETIITIAGFDYDGHKDGDAKQAMFSYPFGIAITDDTIFVADFHNHCIRKIKDGIVSTIAGTPGKQGYEDGTLSHSQFTFPKALLVDADESIVVCDESALRRIDLNQQIVSTLQGVSTVIQSVAISNQFALFAGGENCVMKIENRWKWRRLIWIGYLKEHPNDCLLAALPRDIIKEITQFM